MKKMVFFLVVSLFMACKENSKTSENAVVNADSIPVSASVRSLKDSTATDSLVIMVDSTGAIKMGNQKMSLETLETKLEDSLKIIKKKYGKLPDTILLRKKGDVLMGTRGAINDAIEDAKEKVEKN